MSSHDMAVPDPLQAALYGAPLPEEDLQRRLAGHGLRFPLLVTAAYEQDFEERHRGWFFRPGDGLVYITASRAVARAHPAAGWLEADSSAAWRSAMQQSIVRLRRKTRLRHGHRDLSAQTESNLRQLALQQLHTGHEDWREAVACWSDIIFAQTENKIHDTHRLLLGFATEASRILPTLGMPAYRFHFAMLRMLNTYTQESLYQLLLQALEVIREQLARPAAGRDQRMRRALAFIRHNFTGPLPLDAVATEVSMASAAFSRKFKRATDRTYTEYLQATRLEAAIPLLLQTERTVLDIALECGFGSVEQFHRVFKSQLGTTPLQYRKSRFMS